MKKKKLLQSIIAMFLVIITVFSTITVMAEPLSEAVTEVTTTAEKEEQETFIYPEEKTSENEKEVITNTDEELREPDVAKQTETDEFGKPVVISEHSKIYQTGDNTFKTVYSEIPNTFKENGEQKEYDNTLVLKDKLIGTDYYTNKQSDIDVVLPIEIKENKGVTFEYNKTKVDLIPLEGDYSKSAVKENAILYNDVYDGIDVQYTIHELGLKEDIILNKCVDKSTFSYELDTHGTEAKLENGVINLYEKKSDEPVLTLSAPMMADSDAKICENVELSLSEEDGTYIVIVTADSEWLKSPERAYPVKIDPSFTVPSSKITVITASQFRGVYEGKSYGYAGYLTDDNIGVPGSGDLGKTRMYFAINDDFSSIPEGSKINSASLRIYQYMNYNGGSTKYGCFRIEDSWSTSTLTWNNAIKLNQSPCGENSVVTSAVGFHKFDCRETVNNWVQGIQKNYGFVVQALDETDTGSPFFTPLSSASNPGQSAFTPDKAPQLIIDWEVPNPVDPNYPLDETTINLRTIIETNKDGLLRFHAIFADGVAHPGAEVAYNLNDSSKDQDGKVYALPSYKYPDSMQWSKYFPDRATKYKDILSNWQTIVPFTNVDYNIVYQYSAVASKDGTKGNTAKSDEFLVYKIKQYDTLPKIANYYGVPLEQIMLDNRVQDMLLVENNTIVIINPTKNKNKPYNPEPLSDEDKRKIDSLLIGRAKHCEFGFEPVNLNTGNFYFNTEDVSIPDLNGNFGIERTYNSKSAGYNSSFGRGWHFEYDEYISKLSDGTYVYSRGDGSAIYFEPNGKGGYTCPDGYNLIFTPVKIGEKEGDFGGEKLEKYNVYEYEVRSADGEVRRFNTMGILTKITDSKGFVTSLSYDDNYNLKSVTSPSGTAYSFSYTADGYIKAITLPNGKQLTYAYDNNNNLVSYKNANGNETKYAYDGKHQMTSWTDPEGNVIVTNTFDNEGRVTKQVDANGAISTLAYSNGKTTATDANGNVTIYYYDSQFRTTKIEYPNGSTELKTYDSSNNLASVTDKNGNKTEYTYDNSGNILTEKRFDGAVKKYEYNRNNQITKVTDYDGKVTSYEYNSAKDLIKQINNDGTSVSFKYDDKHRLVKNTDANGNTVTFGFTGAYVTEITTADKNTIKYSYDSMGNLISVVDQEGNITRYTYDSAGRKLSEQAADGGIIHFTFDKAGSVTTITDAKGSKTTFTYDGMGNIISAVDPLGNNTNFTYDALNNKLTETNVDNKTITYTYDSMSNLSSATDADGNTTSYEYDNCGNLIKTTYPNGNIETAEFDNRFGLVSSLTNGEGEKTQFKYDTVGNIVKQINVDGSATDFTYDDMNRVIKSVSSTGLETTYLYDNNSNVTSVSDNMGRVIKYSYDVMDNNTEITMPDGSTVKYEYDSLGRVVKSTDGENNTVSYTYDAMGRVISATDQIGRVTKYEYDLNGNIVKQIAANNGITTYEYDKINQLTKITDALEHSTSFAYTNSEVLSKITDVYGSEMLYEFNGRNLTTKVTDELGNAYSLSYDGNGNVISTSDAKGNTTAYTYDNANRLIKAVSPEGLEVTYTYNKKGQLVKEADNTGSSNSYEYDSAGRLLKITDALNYTTEYTYDKLDNITSIKAADGTTTTYEYDLMGNVSSIIDAEGNTTNYLYDKNGNLISKEDEEHRLWQYHYDAVGRLTKDVNPLEEENTYEYNALDMLTLVTDANGNSTAYNYDILGNLLSKTDGNGNKTSYEYDALYRLINTTAADGGKEEYLYDAASQLIKYKDALGNITSYEYDPNGNLSKLINPNGGIYSYNYNKDNYQISVTDPLENVTSYTYDLAGRLTAKTLPNNAEYTYSYDAIGRIIGQTAPEGLSRTYSYDDAGNLASETDQSGRTTSYVYDIMHRLTSSRNAKGAATTLTYDSRGNLSTLSSPLGNTTTFEYDLLDRISKTLDPVGRVEEYTYDPVGNIIEITKNGGRAYTYTYDNVGNLTSVTNPLDQVQNFTYDSMNRLTSETDLAGNATSYTYDLNGQLTSVTDRNGGVSSYTYDANGNVTSITDPENRKISYTYDLLDRITAVTEGETQTAAYEYDSVGNLTKYTDGNGNVTEYTYNKLGNMTSITDPLGNVKEFSYNVNAMLDTVTNPDGSSVNYDYDVLDELIAKSYDNEEDPQALYGYDLDGNKITMDDVAGTTDYEYDEIGRITAVNLSNGKKILYSYDEYGNLEKLTYPDKTSVTYTYNALDQLTQIKDRQGKVTSYERDDNGNVTKVTRPNGTYSTIEYDDMGNVIKVANMHKGSCFSKDKQISSFSYTYDKSGFIVSEAAVNGKDIVINEYEYDERGQLIKDTETVSHNCKLTETTVTSYTYDCNGNRLSDETTKNNRFFCRNEYTYNENNQVVNICSISREKVKNDNCHKNKCAELPFLSIGKCKPKFDKNCLVENIICDSAKDSKNCPVVKHDDEDKSSFCDKNHHSNACDKHGKLHKVNTKFTYDANGNLIKTKSDSSRTATCYTYDNENRLKAVKENGTLLMAALYDGNGDRIFRIDYTKNSSYTSNNAGTTANVCRKPSSCGISYDRSMIAEEMLIPNGVSCWNLNKYELTGYINDVNSEYTQTLMEYGANQSVTNVYEYGEQRNSATINGMKAYYMYDGRGSVSNLTGKNGNTVASYSYDAFGNTTASNPVINNPYQYNAEYTDSSTGLQYLRARYYNSGTGSFITEDTELGSIEKPITRNLYIYCGNNPLNYTDPSGHNWFKNAVNSVKRTASNVVNTVKSGYNTAKNWANTHIVQPVKSFVSNTKTAVTNAYSKGKTYVTQKCNQVQQSYNNAKNWVNNKAQQFYNDYVPPKVQKAIEEAKKFVCTTTDRIVKDTKEFIQNVDWKKVAIGVAATVAVTAVVVATGGAAAPVLIGAAVGAGASTGITVVSGAIQGKTPAEIAEDASDAFMWGAIGGAFSGGTTSLIKSAGQSAAKSFVKSNLIEGGVDTAVDLAQTATQNGGLTPQAVLTSVVINVGGAFIGAPDTPSTTRNQIVDGVTDNRTVKKDYDSILHDFADKADDIVSSDPVRKDASKTVQGTYKHSEFKNMIDDLNDPNLKSEVSFNKSGSPAEYGAKGSIRLDAVEYDEENLIKNVWDLKTGTAGLTDKRKQQIFDVLKEGDNTVADFTIDSIHELRPYTK